MNSDRASSLAKSPILFQSALNSEATLRTKGQTHAIRNNPSHYLGASAYRSIAQLALCGRLGSTPAGILGLVLIIVLILVLVGRI
jgi:uncharacterized protein DUF3309